MLKEGQYYTVNSKGALLKQFRSHKKELDSYVRRHKLNFKKDPVAFITAIVEHYEELTR
ncbi:MAG: hypothetical protein LUE93_03910 [Bacteroides sp.]|nr:hypothetical protein [Bacteroides sp.]